MLSANSPGMDTDIYCESQKQTKKVRFSVASEETGKTMTSAVLESMASPVQMTRRKGPTPLERMVEIQSEAEHLLRSVIVNERAGRWEKVVAMYNALLKLISRRNMPQGFSLTDSYVLLIYESYYHLGLALQNLQRHRDAVAAYTQAIKAVNIHKNGCLAGCNSNTCFQTPVLAKRAFSHAKMGDMTRAFVDIEKAVVLDTRNSDLYCIRALLWNTTKDSDKAVDDLNRALRYNPCHVCALLLRGSIDQPFRISFNFLEGLSLKNNQKTMKKDHIKAQQINPQATQFLDVTDIHSAKLIKLWNRFLWSLNVPRNIVHPELMECFNSARIQQSTAHSNKRTRIIRPKSTPTIQINGASQEEPVIRFHDTDDLDKKPFRCGTPTVHRDSLYTKRAKSYGDAVRTYKIVLQASKTQEMSPTISRPPTAMSTASDRSTPGNYAPARQFGQRTPSAVSSKRLSVSFSKPLLTIPTRRAGTVSAPPTLVQPASRRSSLTVPTPKPRPPSAMTLQQRNFARAASMKSARDVVSQRRRSASEYARKVHGMRVFEPINVTDAPRMYYKPWSGDKLPVGKISRVME